MTDGRGFNIDPAWKGVVKWGGLALFVSAIVLVLFVIGVFGFQQILPVPAKQALENPLVPTALFILTAFGELLLLPGGLALYFSLKSVNNAAAFLAAAIWSVYVPMFLASRGLLIAPSQVSARYLAAGSEMKAAYVAAAELALETQSVYAIMALLLMCIASIIFGLVMLKSAFGKPLGYLVIVTGVLTIFTPFQVILGVPVIIPFIGLVLTAAWQLIVGFKLYQLGKAA
jgi:hypothetical protein